MASLRRTQSGNFIACFRYDGQQHQRALKTREPDAAKAALGAITSRIYKLTTGDLVAPPHVDLVDFIVWGEGAVADPPPVVAAEAEKKPSLEQLFQEYLDDHHRLKADSTLSTERTHFNNLKKALGEKTKLPVDQIQKDCLDAYLRQREEEAEDVTVIKERQTIKSLFDWTSSR
jgi:hypothetical protein